MMLLCAGATIARAQPCDPNINADGSLNAEALLILDLNSNGIPDVLESRFGAALFQIDNQIDGGLSVGPDGFRDGPLANNVIPPCAICKDAGNRARSPMNTGRLTIIYLPDSDQSVNPAIPATDDSCLYVGFDIANGDARRVPPGGVGVPDVDFHDIDFILGPGETLCNAGFPDIAAPIGTADYLMRPFDVDGDGNPSVIGRFADQGNGCLILLEPTRDLFSETYRVEIRTCPIGGIGNLLALVQLTMNELVVGPNVQLEVLEPWHGGPPIMQASAFPTPGMNSAQIQAIPSGQLDVEFVITRVDSALQSKFAAFPFSTNRLRLFNGQLITLSGSTGNISEEDEVRTTFNIRAPQIEVKKEIRCVGEPDNAWRAVANAAPGAQVEFRITVENTGNVPIAASLEDTLQAISANTTITPDLSSLSVLLHRPGNAAGQVVDFNNAIAFVPPMNPDFFDDPGTIPVEGFLTQLNGQRVCLGVLLGVNVCTDPNNPVPGDRVEIFFRANVNASAGFCTQPPVVIDQRNSITAIGDPDVTGPCPTPGQVPPALGNESIDAAGVVDTPRESAAAPPADDNIAAVNLQCTSIQFVKNVAVDCNNDGGSPFTPELSTDAVIRTLDLCGNCFPMRLRYSFTVTNNGETAVDVRACDDELVADARSVPGINVIACQLCNDPGCNGVGDTCTPVVSLPATQSFTWTCDLVIFTLAQFNQFALTDNDTVACPPDNDPECYRNCAVAEATPTGVCNGSPVTSSPSDVGVCVRGCELTVLKQVRCVDCTNGSALGAFTNNLTAVAGGCLEYQIVVTNSGARPISQLRFTDLLDPGCGITLKAGTIACRRNGVPCTNCSFTGPQGFNTVGVPFVYDLAANCSPLNPGDTFTLSFRANVNPGAVPGTTCCNNVTVEGAINCPPFGSVFSCSASTTPGGNPADDPACVTIQQLNYSVVKQVRCANPANSPLADTIEALRGEQVQYAITLCNTGTVNIDEVTLNDVLTCVSGSGANPCSPANNCAAAGTACNDCDFVAGSVVADVRPSGSPVPGTIVTPNFSTFTVNPAQPQNFSLPAGTPIAPGQCLVLTFNVNLGNNIPVGSGIDCYNRITASVPAGGLPNAVCGPGGPSLTDCACVDVVVPQFTFDKLVSLDCGNNGTIDVVDAGQGPGGMVGICDSFFPLRLIYRFKTTNTGDTPLSVRACDDQLVADANAVPGVQVLNCSLCNDPGCTGGGDTCSPFETINPTQMSIRECSLVFPTPQHFRDFALLDTDANPNCYQNTARGEANVQPGPCGVPPAGLGLPPINDTLNVCLPGCAVTVNKQVRCFSPVLGAFADLITAAPGSTVEFAVTVQVGAGSQPLTALQFTELLPCSAAGRVVCDPLSPAISVNGAPCATTVFDPPGFNCNGAPFVWRTSTCNGLAAINPGDTVVLTFRAAVNGPAPQDCVNTNISVAGGFTCDGGPACGGGVSFPCTATDPTPPTVQIRSCGFTVTKQVKCQGAPDATFGPAAASLPGECVTYRVRICNDGTLPITQLNLQDTLTCVTPGAGCCDAAAIQNLAVELAADCTANSGPPCQLTPAFVPDGVLRTHTLCSSLDPGESLIIRFDVCTNPAFNTTGTPIDCRNRIDVSVPGAGLPAGLCGAGCPTLNAEATVNIVVPSYTFDKLLSIDCGNNGSIDIVDAGAGPGGSIDVCETFFPLRLVYKFKITNTGETTLDNVRACDAELLADACAAGLTVPPATCSLCTGPCCAGGNDGCTGLASIPAGGMITPSCDIIIATPAQFAAWAALDGDGNPDCYRNVAAAEADVGAGPCDQPPLQALPDLSDNLSICLRDCTLTLDSQVRCVAPVVGPYVDLLTATPGSTVEWCITVTNTGTRPLNAIEIDDDLLCAPAGPLSCNPATVTLTVNGVVCPPVFVPPFNTIGTPFVWIASAGCAPGGLLPGQQWVLTFRCDVVGPAPSDCTNNVSARGGLDCAGLGCDGAAPVFSCTAIDATPPTVQIRSCAFTAENTVKCMGAPDSSYNIAIDTVPGGKVTYRILVANNGSLPIDELSIADLLSCVSNSGGNPCLPANNCATSGALCPTCQFLAGSVLADVRPCGQVAPGQNVTAAFAAFAPDGVTRTYSLPPAGTIDPGECLHLTFDVMTDPAFNQFNSGVDCYNRATVEVPAGGLPGSLCGTNCTTVTDCACVDIKIPRLICDTQIEGDRGDNGFDLPLTSMMTLPNLNPPDFPLRLRFHYKATNSGELPLINVFITDLELLADACARGIGVENCSLCDGPCCVGGNDTNVGPINLAPGQMQTFTCDLVIHNQGELTSFFLLDTDNQPNCYSGETAYIGDIDNTGLCQSIPPIDVNSSTCTYKICSIGICPRFWAATTLGGKGTQATAIFYTVGGDPPESDGGPGDIFVDLMTVNPENPAADAAPSVPPAPPGTPEGGDPEGPGFEDRANATQKGSLLYFGAIEIKWNAQGQIIQDTIVTILNDHSTQGVRVKWYIINGDAPLAAVHQIPGDPNSPLIERAHPGWNFFDAEKDLTHDQATYWRASTGQPMGIPPFIALDPGNGNPMDPFPGNRPGRPDTDPANVGGRVLRGFAVCWAVNTLSREIRWNHLQGTVIGIDLECNNLWEYTAWSFKCLAAVANGQEPDAVPGQLLLNGDEYDWAPDLLVFDFFAAGSMAFSSPQVCYKSDTDLTLWVPDLDVRNVGGTGPVCHLTVVDVWNEDEVKLTNMTKCFCCWDQEFISRWTLGPGIVNHFKLENLGSNKGKASIDAIADPSCEHSVNTPLLGVYVKCFQLCP